jgi:secreted PhoX family phosphatase
MDRRGFFRVALASAGATAMLPTAAMAGAAHRRQAAEGPYGTIDGRTPDDNGLLLPEGFTSRRIAVAGEPVAGTGYRWHVFPDGAATFDDGDGGWFYVCNSEVFGPDGAGGASAVHFDAEGEIVDAYRVLEGTTANCAGGPTPWGTWLSCEERFDGMGQVWEVDPTGESPGEARPALGRWAHEAVAVDPDDDVLYLTEDDPGGKLYRFTPDAYPDLSAGRLEAAVVASDGSVTWTAVADPSGTTARTRDQVPDATTFPGNEGIWYHDRTIVFTSKGDNRVHAIDLDAQRYSRLWDGSSTDPLSGVDNITVAAASGDVFVAEDGGNMEVVLVTPEGDVVPFVRVVEPGHEGSEITGPAFSPDGTRLYFSSQRGPTPGTLAEIAGDRGVVGDSRNGGTTWEVTGPFRSGGSGGGSPSTTLAGAAEGSAADPEGDGDGSSAVLPIAGAALALGAVGAGAWWVRSRRTAAAPTAGPTAGPSAGDDPAS